MFSINILPLQSVRERIEDKRKAVLGAMSPSVAMELSSQRSGQLPFPYSSPFVDQRATQLTSPSMSPFSDLGSIRTTPVASSPGQGLYEEMGSRLTSPPGSEQHQQEPKQPTSLADRLRTSLTGGDALSHYNVAQASSRQQAPPMQRQGSNPVIISGFQRDNGASSQAGMPGRATETTSAQQAAASAADAQLLSALRVCSDAGALGTVLHVRDALPHQPEFPPAAGHATGAPAFTSDQPRSRPQPQPQRQMSARYSWEAGQQQQQLKKPRLAHDDSQPGSPTTGAAPAHIGGYDGAQSWARAPAPVSIGSIEEPLRGQPIGYMSDLVPSGKAGSFGARGQEVTPGWERSLQRAQQQPQPHLWQQASQTALPQLGSGASSQRTTIDIFQGMFQELVLLDSTPSCPGELRPGTAGVDVPVITEHQEPRRSLVKAPPNPQVPAAHAPTFTGAPLSGGPLSGGPFLSQPPAPPLQGDPAAAPQLKRRRSIEMQESEEDVYVLFNLPQPNAHRAQQQPSWDSPAAALLSLSTSSSFGEGGLEDGTGPVRCQWLFSKQLTASDTNKLGRIILPRQAVEHFLPWVEERAGLDLNTCDTSGTRWAFKLKFWMNGSNPKRMYVVENTRNFVRSHNLKPGSILSFYCAPDGQLVVDPHPVDDYFEVAM
ncbi:g8374 [Coccomyxa elongata]